MATPSKKKVDVLFLVIVLSITAGGFLLFLSAAMGYLTQSSAQFTNVVITQGVALVLGLVALYVFSHIHYRFWRKHAFTFLFVAVMATLLVFIPGLGIEHGGAVRWLSAGPFTIQPSEILKVVFIIYCAAWLSGITTKLDKVTYGLLPLTLLIGIVALVLLSQPDTNTLIVIATASTAMFFVAGARWRDIGAIVGLGIVGFLLLIWRRPYIYDRVITLINPSAADGLGSGYQIQQSLIAIGSGDWLGRGFGQSVQKFHFLPEAPSDSIFAVAAEELGFIGALVIVTAFLLLIWRGFYIAMRAPDVFSRLLVVGIVIMVATQAITHIGGMIGILPVSGAPLLFVSLGGTALIMTLASMGIVLNISRYSHTKPKKT